MPKTVLIVAPHFPPSALPPSHRARQFAAHLPRYGWHPIILTVHPEYLQEPLEPEMNQLVPAGVEVIRTKALPPRRPRGWFGIGELGSRVLIHHANAASRLCIERKIDLLYLPCPPNHQLLIGRYIRARFGVPYVFDYTDPWISQWVRDRARPFTKLWVAHLLSVILEPIAVKRMSTFTSVSLGTNEGILRRYQHLSPASALALPYGGEPEVFEYVRANPRAEPYPFNSKGRTNLLYLGAMWEAGYETLRAFLRALAAVRHRRPDLYCKCHVHFVGTCYQPNPDGHFQVLPEAERIGVADAVTEQPRRLPFLDSVDALTRADGLLMLGSVEPHYTASRLLPYLLAKRPILAAFHEESDATKLLRRRQGVRLVTYGASIPAESRIDEIYSKLTDLLANAREADLTPIDHDPEWEPYTVRSLTGQLAELFERVLATETVYEPLREHDSQCYRL